MKILLIIVFLFFNIYASSIKKNIILDKQISKDNILYQSYRKINFEKELFKKVYIKIPINKKLLKNKILYLKVYCDTLNIVYSNEKYQTALEYIIYKLDNNTPKELLLHIEYKNPSHLRFGLTRLNEFEYNYMLKNEFLLFGMAYGIIFCAFLYNLIIFLYSQQKSFLYYSFMQLFLMFSLYYIVLMQDQTYFTQEQQILTDFFETSCLLLMILFSKEILNTKKNFLNINKVLSFFIYLNIIDLIAIFIFKYSVLYTYLPRSIIIFFLLLSALMAVYKGQKDAIFYIFAWLIVLIAIVIEEQEFLEFSSLYIMHIALPLESLFLSFALGYKLRISINEKKEKEEILIQQSKLALMGEMMNNIAHQWRQPLNNLSFINMDLQMATQNNDIETKYLNQIVKDSKEQIVFMSETLENFKGFYLPNRKKEEFKISTAIKNAINIIKASLEEKNIKLELQIIEDKTIKAYENEYSQVVLNILTNAKDALIQREIKNPFIKIILNKNKNNKSILSIEDNARGIDDKIINKIFDPYFTSKENNSGIGLYMSKIITESHLNGNIYINNTSYGACFTLEI